MKKIIFMGLMSLFVTAIGRAGQESHGGHALVCPAQPTVLLDYHYAALPFVGGQGITNISAMSTQQVIDLFKSKFNGSDFGRYFSEAVGIVGNISEWTLTSNLVLQNDASETFAIPAGCTLEQLAVRDGSTVFVDTVLYSQLSPAQAGLLAVHETLFYLAEQKGIQTSSSVRGVIKAVLQNPENYAKISISIKAMGWKYSYLDVLNINENMGPIPHLNYSGSDNNGANEYRLYGYYFDKESRTLKGYLQSIENNLMKYKYYGDFHCTYNDICSLDSQAGEPDAYPIGTVVVFNNKTSVELRIPGEAVRILFSSH